MDIKARVPGAVEEILVKEGDQVKAADIVIRLEAMKMIQQVPSPVAGEVTEILVEKGERVKAGAVLMRVE